MVKGDPIPVEKTPGRPGDRGDSQLDRSLEALRKHFSEREIVEITWLNAVENLRSPYGVSPHGLYTDSVVVTSNTNRAAPASATSWPLSEPVVPHLPQLFMRDAST